LEQINTILSWQRGDPAEYSSAVEKLLSKWAETDPAAAVQFALQPLDDDNIHALFLDAAGGIVQDWARRDPVAARLFFENLKSAKAAEILAPALMLGYASRAPESALEWVHSGLGNDSGHLREILAKSVVSVYDSLGRREQVIRWLSMPDVAAGAHGKAAAGDLARYLARSSPDGALAFSKAMPAGSAARADAIQETFRQWASGDPAGCSAWLARYGSQPDGSGDSDANYARAGFAIGVAAIEPARKMEQVAAITDDTLRASVLQVLKPQH
jgi:hypothetical protein